jgi:hypothetical protein
MMSANERSADKFSRAFAERYGVEWAKLTPQERDQWRQQVTELLAYIDSTAFRSFLPGASEVEGS